METKLRMIYWNGEKFWVGKLLDHPEIMTQRETLEELEENMKDAFLLMTMDETQNNPSQSEPDDMLPEYDFSGQKGVRGKYHEAYRQSHTVKIEQEDSWEGEPPGEPIKD